MFNGCTGLTAAPKLPETTLASYCYSCMFNGCTSLTTAPELPATTLAVRCYNNMFSGCTSLTTAPELPATTLAIFCYYSMFYGCTSLTAAPELPATELVTNCYASMFNGCTGIMLSETQTAEYSIPYSVPSGGNGTLKATNALNNMFANTGGTFKGKPTINTTYYRPAVKYTVTWKNGDTVLKTDTVEEGGTPVYSGETPVKAEDEQNTYTFSGWTDGTDTYGTTDTLPAVTGDVTYTATFTETPKVVELPEVIKDCTYQKTDSNVFANVPFMPADSSDFSSLVEGAIVVSSIQSGKIQLIDAKGYSYKFYDQTGTEIASALFNSASTPGSKVGLGDGVTVYGKIFNLTLPENFEKLYIVATTPTTYTVTWKNGDTVLKTDTVEKGNAPAYTGTAPEKAEDAENTYTFSSWTDGTNTYGKDDTLPAVTGDITYTATFDASAKYTYMLDGNNVTIIGYNGTDRVLTIPSEIDGHPVVTIGASAFYQNETITSVVIPNTVTNVEYRAFGSCPNLTSVTLPDSLKTIGDNAFAYCDKLTGLVIPDSVTHIGDYAVEYCPKLTTLVIGNKVEFIGEDAFEGCVTLNNVVLPDSLKTMEEFAFYECMALEEINIPAGITNIARFTFFNCEKLEAVNFARPTSEQTLRFAANVFTKGNNYVPIGTVLRYSGEGNYALFDGDTMVAEGTDLSTLANKTLTWRPAYTVTWANWDNSVIKTDTVVEGNAPAYTGTAPEKAEDAENTYTFSGWTDGTTTYGASDTLPAVTGDITYTATFTATEKHLNGPQDDGYFYLDDVKQIRYQLIQWHGDYYFINDGDKYAKNTKLYLSNTYVAGTGLAAGLYEFGADGKMQLKNGPQDDGYFYENGIRSNKLYRFVEFEGDWYFIYDAYKYAKNARLYLSGAFLEGTDFAPGYFDFDADGKYFIPEELPDGANADGYFYINGVKQTRYQLIKNGNDYYFINDDDKYAKNTKLYLSSTYVSGTDLPAGLYEFGADGKMIISALKNGPQDDGYFYINGARCQKLYRFVEFDGDWYFINDGYKYAKNARLYLGNAFLEGTDFAPGYFVFGADGKLVTA
jgi:hypothetical protein